MTQAFHLGDPLAVAGAVDSTAFIANTATLVGDIRIGQHASIWFSAVLRADLASITIGDHTSVQDGAVIHVDDVNPTTIGDHVTIGHGAVVHGCEIEEHVLIGIRAVVLSQAHIGHHSIIGAGAVVTEGMHIPPNSLVMGIPGRVVKSLTAKHEAYIKYAQEEYVALTQAFKAQRPDLDQLPRTSPNRRD